MMNDDMALVREYASRNSEEAFAALVSRHVNLVHSAALRQVHDPHQAEEITQTVFIILARKAGSLNSKTILPGWLYRTANYVSAAALKIQHRRERREQEAYMQAMIPETQTDVTWEQLSPLLDGAMTQLRESDRAVLVLRFFQNKNFKEVGDALGVEERAAQKRVARALEKLRTIFVKRGVTSTTATLAGAISANSVQAAPAALIKTTTAVALAKGATASASTLTLIKGALKIMAWTKAQTAIVSGVVLLLAVGASVVTVKEIRGREISTATQPPVFTQAVGATSNATTEQTPSEKTVAPKQVQPQTIPVNANAPAQNDSTNSISQSVDALLSATNNTQKYALFVKLWHAGELDQAIAGLQQREAANPDDPEIPTTLGEALLIKVQAILYAKDNPSGDEGRILLTQAMQDFDAALKIDPQNWEAQFVKYSTMQNWPVNPQTDNQVIQQLTKLIDQQQTMPSQPQFAQTYFVLGEEYQKIGQPDKAQATWQLGLQEFPNDLSLRKIIANPSSQ
jgi:RNA polymerase sigma factor (sigma-70 family)